MNFVLMTKSTFPIIGWFAELFGWIMNVMYNALSAVGIENIAITIIVFTVLTSLIMLPLTVSQQKFMKISGLMQPELQALQKKYKGKTDSNSVAKMNAEQQAIYDKYGVSPTGSCLPVLLQFPIMLGLYQVILKLPAYISQIKLVFMNVAEPLMKQPDFIAKIGDIAAKNAIDVEKLALDADVCVDLLYKFKPAQWESLMEMFPSMSNVIQENLETINHFNTFLSINMAETPGDNLFSIAILIPILAGLSQYISTKLMTQRQSAATEQMASLNTMNTMMPIMSVVFCFMLPSAVGVYWVVGTLTRMVFQIGVNKYMDSMEINDLIKKNIAKKNKARAKKGLPPINEQQMLNKIEKEKKRMEQEEANKSFDREKRDAEQAKSTEYYNSKSGNMGSISSRARMVKEFNERSNKN